MSKSAIVDWHGAVERSALHCCTVIWMASDRPKYQKRQLFNPQTFRVLNGSLHMPTWKFISILKFWKHFWFRYLSLKLSGFRVFHHFLFSDWENHYSLWGRQLMNRKNVDNYGNIILFLSLNLFPHITILQKILGSFVKNFLFEKK